MSTDSKPEGTLLTVRELNKRWFIKRPHVLIEKRWVEIKLKDIRYITDIR